MSLTSYRAAPPRAIAVNRFAVYPLIPGFAGGKIPLFVCSELSKTKGPLEGGPCFGWAEA
jgi:hypothetical protein